MGAYDPFKNRVTADLEDFKKASLDINPSYAPNQVQIVDLVDMYWMDKFRDGDSTKEGWKKAFYNVLRNPTYVSQKMVDLDTKDIRITAAEGASFYPAWLYSRDLMLYMRINAFGRLLNEVVYNTPKYGSILLKNAKGKVFYTPMRNIKAVDQDVSKLEEVGHLIEGHEYTPGQLRAQGWDESAVEEAIREAPAGARICVYERFGDISGETMNYWIGTASGIVLHREKYADIRELYRKIDWEEIPGRFLGRGVPESLFESQIHKNRITNFKTEGLHWSSKHIFQTRDTTVRKNLMTGVDNGEVLHTNDPITPLVNEERNLAAYQSEDSRWDKLINDLTFAYNELAGERPPAGTPLGTSVLQSQQAGGYFDMRREDIGLALKDVILDWVIPGFKNEKYTEHQLMLGEFDEQEVSKLRELFTTKHGNENILRYIARNGAMPDFQQQQLLIAAARERVNRQRDITIPKAYYNDVKYKVDVIITNEQLDVAARLTTLQTALQILASNPGILTNPRTKRIFFKLLDLSGISPVELGIDDASAGGLEETLQQLRPGGSISRPQATPSPVQLPQTAAI